MDLNSVPELTERGRQKLESVAKDSQTKSKRDFIPNVDGRQKRAKEMWKLYNDFVLDMGGDNYATAAQKELARRCATLSVLAQELEEQIAEQHGDGETVDKTLFGQYMDVCKTSSQLMTKLNRVRVIDRDPEGLDDYIQSKSS